MLTKVSDKISLCDCMPDYGNIEYNKCYFCGHINRYTWLICENPDCEEVKMLDKLRDNNQK